MGRQALTTRMTAACRSLLVIAMAALAQPGHGQSLYYVEPGVASCPTVAAPTTAAPKPLTQGEAAPGRIHVSCGFDQGSYTVTLNSTDPAATLVPKTFLVNFGRIVGNGVFSVTFSTLGVQSVSATITSNMGSPAVQGQFVSPANQFKVVPR